MIIDNVGDSDIFAGSTNPGFPTAKMSHSPKSLKNFIPPSSQGSVLVISRYLQDATILVGSPHNVVEVGVMTDEDALALLKSRVLDFRPLEEEEEAKTLVKTLGCHPLAVVQATSFIAREEPGMNIAEFLQIYRETQVNLHASLND